jgi:hypothetical protein
LAGHDPERYELEPGGRAILFRTFTIPPDSEVLPRLAEIRARMGPNAGINLENEADYGLHRTSTIDFICVVAGEIHLRLDSGDDVCLRPGDCVVQRGTMHAWRNLSSSPCLMSAVMIGTGP